VIRLGLRNPKKKRKPGSKDMKNLMHMIHNKIPEKHKSINKVRITSIHNEKYI